MPSRVSQFLYRNPLATARPDQDRAVEFERERAVQNVGNPLVEVRRIRCEFLAHDHEAAQRLGGQRHAIEGRVACIPFGRLPGAMQRRQRVGSAGAVRRVQPGRGVRRWWVGS